jgi:hypothetical protein
MLKAVVIMLSATFLSAAAAYARTAQQSLHTHLVQQAGKSRECPMVPVSNAYCNPLPVAGSAKDAEQALAFMLTVERLGASCSGEDIRSCQRQAVAQKGAAELGWCAQPTKGINWENVIVWARCPKDIVIYGGN